MHLYLNQSIGHVNGTLVLIIEHKLLYPAIAVDVHAARIVFVAGHKPTGYKQHADDV